jgi:hypothetical protein
MKGTRVKREHELARYLWLLARGAPKEALLDVRFRRDGSDSMVQEFHATTTSRTLARLLTMSERADVYVGIAPRTRRAGGRDALGHCRLLWADCDSDDAVAALAHVPAPTMLVASGFICSSRTQVPGSVGDACWRRVADTARAFDGARWCRRPR